LPSHFEEEPESVPCRADSAPPTGNPWRSIAREMRGNGGHSLRKIAGRTLAAFVLAPTLSTWAAHGIHPSSVELAEPSSVADRSARKGPRAPHDITARTQGTLGVCHTSPSPRPGCGTRPRAHHAAHRGRDPNQRDPDSKRLPIVFWRRERRGDTVLVLWKGPVTKSVGLRTRAAAPRTIAQPHSRRRRRRRPRSCARSGSGAGRVRAGAVYPRRHPVALGVRYLYKAAVLTREGAFHVVGAARRRTRRRPAPPSTASFATTPSGLVPRGGGDPALHHLRG
jgi:hypothetical protein